MSHRLCDACKQPIEGTLSTRIASKGFYCLGCASLPCYESLTTSNRHDPCREYPGAYHVYADNNHVGDFYGEYEGGTALDRAKRQALNLPDAMNIAVYWAASEDDPRIGQGWFTSYYRVWTWSRP